MNESQYQFRVGLFVLVAIGVISVMAFQFGELDSLWQDRYVLTIHFDEAPGVFPETPVRKNGLAIGEVRDVVFDDEKGGVLVIVEIDQDVTLRTDAQPTLTRSVLGDSAIDFVPGRSTAFLEPGAVIEGTRPTDPIKVVERVEQQVAVSLDTFNATAEEWQKVGENINSLVGKNGSEIDLVIQNAAESMSELAVTMRTFNTTLNNANQVIGDSQNQENMQKTLAALPEMVEETRATISAVKLAVTHANENLQNLEAATAPMAKYSTSIVSRLDQTMANFESLSTELYTFAQLMNREDGSLQRFAGDPELYHNLNESAELMTQLLTNLEPVLRDLRIFSDKIARHPELIGVRGALRGSSGLKETPQSQTPQQSEPPSGFRQITIPNGRTPIRR